MCLLHDVFIDMVDGKGSRFHNISQCMPVNTVRSYNQSNQWWTCAQVYNGTKDGQIAFFFIIDAAYQSHTLKSKN